MISRMLIIILLLITAYSCVNFSEPRIYSFEIDTFQTEIYQNKPQILFFGIPADSFNLISGQIKRNGLLSQILIRIRYIKSGNRHSGKKFFRCI